MTTGNLGASVANSSMRGDEEILKVVELFGERFRDLVRNVIST